MKTVAASCTTPSSLYNRNSSNQKLIAALSLITIMIILLAMISVIISASDTAPKYRDTFAKLSERVTIQAAGRGNPWISMADGRDVITPASGPQHLTNALENNQVEPLSLASADFDEDGVPDLISSYSSSHGAIVTLMRGNVDSIYQNAAEARQHKDEGTFTDSPFLGPTFVFAVPESADFIGAGDFDGDSHWDVVAAGRGSRKLYLLSGDGSGNLGEPREINLSGEVTAMTVGEINRRDGLDDIVVGITGTSGSKALVFEGPDGALRADPESFDLSAKVTSFALGQLDDSYEIDMAAAVGHELIILHGRDRKLSLDATRQTEVKSAVINRLSFPFIIHSIAAGNFSGSHDSEIAMLSDEGIFLLDSEAAVSKNRDINKWRVIEQGSWSKTSKLVFVRASGEATDNLAIVDSTVHQLRISTSNIKAGEQHGAEVETSRHGIAVLLDLERAPIAILPMRLNADTLSDLVILKAGQGRPSVTITQAQSTFTVINTNDDGTGSLRDAINQANNNQGMDAIVFSIPGAGVPTILLRSGLPSITDAVTIDGTSQAAGRVELDGTNAGDDESGLIIEAGNSLVRGLVINRFDFAGIELLTNGSNVIEGNFIGTNSTGKAAPGNGGIGVFSSSASNTIGGTTTNARNVISRNQEAGIFIEGGTATNNRVEGNLIGTNAAGTKALGNVGTGVLIVNATINVIGGTIAGAGNVISGNEDDGINIEGLGAANNQVQSNFIGTDINGTAKLSNGSLGVFIINGSSNIIGGTIAGARNIISGNNDDGINIGGIATSNNQVQGNFIGTDVTGTKSVANLAAGIYVAESSDNTIGGTIVGARNIISGNGDEGVAITNGAIRSQVQGNFIGTDVTGTRSLGNSNGVTVTQALNVTIGGASSAARNIISGNLENGIGLGQSILHGPTPNLFGGTGTVIQNNFIGTDVSGTAPVPNAENGIFVETESLIYTIKDNLIAFNGENGIFIPDNGGHPGTPGFRVQILSNSIFSNEALPIDLGNAGLNVNDDKDPDTGANELQNSPVLNSATLSIPALSADGVIRPAAITISGTFNSTPNTNFTLEFYFGLSCSGQGSQLIGFVPIRINTLQVTTDGNGNVPYAFSLDLPGGQRGGYVNCTATNPTGNTSEFSECITVGAPSPAISTAVINGKNLTINGGNFERGANILLNGQIQKTKFNSSSLLTAKKLGKKIRPGDKLKIRNPNGIESEEFTFTGS